MATQRSPNHHARSAPGHLTGQSAAERGVTHRCANCDIIFDWLPTRIGQAEYCCSGCADGGPCCCDYDNLPRSAPEQPSLALSPGDRPKDCYEY